MRRVMILIGAGMWVTAMGQPPPVTLSLSKRDSVQMTTEHETTLIDSVAVDPTTQQIPPHFIPGQARDDGLSVTGGGDSSSHFDKLSVTSLISRGYLEARVQNGNPQAGPLFRIHSIRMEGRQGFTAGAQGLAGFSGQPASSETVRKVSEKVKQFLLNSGLLFSSVRFDLETLPDSLSRPETSPDARVVLVIALDTGPEYKLGKFLIEGTRTRPDVLMRLSLLKEGETFSKKRLSRAVEKLARTGYFLEAAENGLFRDSVRHVLYPSLLLADNRGSSISGLLGYVSEGEGEVSGLNGFLDIRLRNLLGTARDFDFNFSSLRSERRVHLEYKEPWILKLPAGGAVNVSVLVEDSIYNEQSLGLRLFQDIDFRSSYSVSYTVQQNEDFQETAAGDIVGIPSSAVITGIAYTWDWRGAVPNTLRGGVMETGLNGLRRRTADTVDYLLQNTLSLRLWRKAGRKTVLHAGLHGAGAWPLETSIKNRGNLFQAGGANTIRGYRENEFRTNLFGYMRLEYQYLLSPLNRVFVFTDPGLVNRLKGDIDWIEVLGYGLGAELGSREWVFKISYALSPDRNFGDGLLHVGAENNF